MSAFDKVIGYDAIKNELLQVIDMIRDPERYSRLGARMPKGILLEGRPGLGKTLMCGCFMEEAGIPCFTVRRDSADEDFINKITSTFIEAKEQAPSIVFLDDMDKFANEDRDHCDAPEYVAVQSGIDSVRDDIVLVLATANDIGDLPDSLCRAGRFDRTISVPHPSNEDASRILRYYLEDKHVSEDVDFDDVVKMVGSNACCVLETAMNEAAIYAAYDRAEAVGMEHILRAVLRLQYNCPDDTVIKGGDELEKIAMHEAGHLVISEVLQPGSIGLASIKRSGRGDAGGFVHSCLPVERMPYDVLISLGGKAATELYYPNCASGCQEDIQRALDRVQDAMIENANRGFGLTDFNRRNSNELMAAQESASRAELNRYYSIARSVLIENREFLEKAAKALAEKETLLHSDIKKLRESCKITPCYV